MKALRSGFLLLLPMLVIAGLWILAEDRQQAAHLESVLRYVPGESIVLNRVQEPLPTGDSLVELGAEFLYSLLPTSLGLIR